MPSKLFLYSVSILIGTIVGVGIFGIPFSFAKAGFLTGFLFLILTCILSLAINLIFGEIILRTNRIHQFIGYGKIYLNQKFKILSLFAWFLSIYGALLAYIIISGNFLFNIFLFKFNLNPFFYSILFFIFSALALLAGLRTVAWFELFMTSFFIIIIFLVSIFGLPKIDFKNFQNLFNKEFWFLPYGVLLFAFAGFSAIPVQREILSERYLKFLKKSIYFGTLIPAILYLLFSIVVVGISGDSTSPDAISGLSDFFDYKIIFLISLFGLFAITTSFLALSWALIETFRFDYNFKKITSWAITVFIPLIMFISGVRNFIKVISLAGSIAIGIEGILLILIYLQAKKFGERTPEYSLNLPKLLLYITIVLFALGAGYGLLK